MNARAVFLDRDGTIIEDTGYVDDAAKVRLLPGAAGAIARLNRAGYLVVIVSNQSGVARGLFDEDTLSAVHQRMETLLRNHGATIDGAYYCPYLDGPDATVVAYRRDSGLRKPKPGMLHQAAEELDIDLEASWMIGDSKRDVQAGNRAACRTIRLASEGDAEANHTVLDLAQAVAIVEGDGKPTTDRPETTSPPTPTRGGSRLDSGASAPSVPARDTNEPTGGGRSVAATVPAKSVPPSARSTAGSSAPRGARGQSDENHPEVVRVLERIHDELERANRPKRQHDFSMVRLFGALLQMLAVVAAVLGVMKMTEDQDAAATARYMLACFLQLASLTAFAIDRFR